MEASAMKIAHRKFWIISGMLVVLAAMSVVLLRVWLHGPVHGLPYHDRFVQGKADEWQALGGTWELANGMMRNNSDERGAKLLVGSPRWHNYSIEADVYLLGVGGDAGLLIRTGDAEQGVNAYSGYYAGVRTLDNTLVLGRAQHNWLESAQRNPVSSGIRPFQWYHIKLLAYECQIVASVSTPGNTARTAFGASDTNCIRTGRAGLRSYASGGIWRNVTILPASHTDLDAMLKGGNSDGDGSRRGAVTTGSEQLHIRREQEDEAERAMATSSNGAQSIANLRFAPYASPEHYTVRGVVTLTAPSLYVQDSTGGVLVQPTQTLPLKVGDEVEVTGEAHPGDFSSSLSHATVRVLWSSTPIPPFSITASQASTGAYDATFVEVRGRLANVEHGVHNTVVLDLEDGAQSFRAILNPGRSSDLLARLRPNSILRLRGICVTDPSVTGSISPFVLLLRSNEDLDVIAGPPWWNTGHVIEIVVALLVFALVAVFAYHRVENWRLRAVMQERERLAHEMHDTLAQSFAGIGFQLQAIRNGLTGEPETVTRQLDLATSLVQHSHQEARRAIASLRTEELETEDLLAALERCARRMTQEGAVALSCRKEGDQRSVPLRVIDTLYRIGQEAIANAIRHAHPALLTILVRYSADLVSLEVTDDGQGFVQSASLLGFGLRGIRRRAQSIHATLHIDSAPGTGTRIRVDAPLPPRITFFNWPKHALKFIVEHRIHARSIERAHSSSDRG